ANGGDLRVPILVSEVRAPDGRVIEEFRPNVRRRVPVSTDHIQYLTDALVGGVADPAGTAYEARIAGLSVAGKTGTAEVSRPPAVPPRACAASQSTLPATVQ